ncbi:MAG: hypothetical protein WCT04_13480 [Planctomycetota bacterium]
MFIPSRVDQLAKSAAIKDHVTAGQQMIGGSRVIQHWDLTGDKATAKPALTAGQLDVFTMSPHMIIPDPGIDNFVDLGLKHNPNLTFFVQASWVPFDMTPDLKKITDNSQRDQTDLDAWQKANDTWRGQMEAQVDALNTKYDKKAVFIVPVGDAVLALRRSIKKGDFPGITKQSQLFRDPIGHGQGQIMALTAYCNFAAIYKKSPIGLKLAEVGVSTEQHAILQRIAWETVSKYERSGVK